MCFYDLNSMEPEEVAPAYFRKERLDERRGSTSPSRSRSIPLGSITSETKEWDLSKQNGFG